MKSAVRAALLTALVVASPVHADKRDALTPDLGKINDGATWKVINAVASTERKDGAVVVKLAPKGVVSKGSNVGLALVEGLDFGQGTLDVDLKGLGSTRGSFVGLTFGAEGGRDFEAVYFRPFNFQRNPPEFRTHSVQYVAWPDHTWEKLRASKPGVFESTVDPVPDPAGWFHTRIEVAKDRVSVFVNDAKKPCLSVDRLSTRRGGKVGLFVDSNEGYFRNLKIQPVQ